MRFFSNIIESKYIQQRGKKKYVREILLPTMRGRSKFWRNNLPTLQSRCNEYVGASISAPKKEQPKLIPGTGGMDKGKSPFPPAKGSPFPPAGGFPFPPAKGLPFPPAGGSPFPPSEEMSEEEAPTEESPAEEPPAEEAETSEESPVEEAPVEEAEASEEPAPFPPVAKPFPPAGTPAKGGSAKSKYFLEMPRINGKLPIPDGVKDF